MKQVHLILSLMLLVVCSLLSQAQQTVATNTNGVVPPLVNYSGALSDENGKPLTGVVAVTFSLYPEQTGGSALWMETQNVQLDRSGHYTVMLGSTSSTGLPADIFVAGEAHWLGVQVGGEAEQPRVLLVSAPYALKAGDAQTLGGLPASAFVLAAPTTSNDAETEGMSANSSSTSVRLATTADVTTSGGTVNTLPLFSTATNIQNSLITQTSTTAINIGGKLNLLATGTATASAGKDSHPQDFVASAFNSGTSTAVAQTFQLQAEPAGNDTATTSGTFNLLYGSGTATPAETGFKINNKGLITFASGQTFPGTGDGTITGVTTASGSGLTGGGTSGVLDLTLTKACASSQVLQWNGSAWACSSASTGTITGVTAGTNLTGGGTSGKVTLSLNTTATNALYAQLAAANTFAPQQVIKGNGSNAIIGDPGCGSGFSGIGLTSSTLAGCVNYTLIGKSSGDVYLNSTSTGSIHFRNNNDNGDLVTIDNFGDLYVVGQNGGGSLVVDGTTSLGQTTVTTDNTSAASYVRQVGSGSGVVATSPNVALYGQAGGPSNEGAGLGDAGVWGDTGGTSDEFSGVLGSADDNNAGAFYNNPGSDTGSYAATLYAANDSNDNSSLLFFTYGGIGGGFPGCTIDGGGDLSCSGTVSGAVRAGDDTRKVMVHAVQSPENWFEDFGSGTLANGVATVALDPTFASTVNTTTEYHVFLTPRGECEGLYIASTAPGGFEVRELHHGTSSVAFDYRIVAKRAGYENQRLEDVSERYQKMQQDGRLRRERMQQRRAARTAAGPIAAPVAAHK
jgi:hypothetical protein